MKKYNVGIIGYGWVATAHIAAINATRQAQVTAVCSARKLDAAELGAKHGGQFTVYRDLDALLADKSIHAVSICSYPYEHAKQAVASGLGMSVVPEVIAARHCGLKVAGMSAITNLAEGLTPFPLSHEQTLKYAAIAAKDMVTLIHGFIERLGKTA